MEYIIASWEDVYRQTFLTELYPAEEDVDDLLDYFVHCKDVYSRTVVKRYPTRISFSDGSQVSLRTIKVQHLPIQTYQEEPKQLEAVNDTSGKPF